MKDSCLSEGTCTLLKAKNQNKYSEKLPKWIAAILMGLLIAYYVLTLITTNRITGQVEMISNHPYPVAIAVDKVNTGIAQLRILPERLIYARTPQVIEAVDAHYDTIDQIMTEKLAFIAEKYISHPEDAVVLQQVYIQLRDVQQEFLALCADPSFTSEDTAAFFVQNIEPKLNEMNVLTDSMIVGSQIKFAEFEQQAYHARFITILLSTLLTIAVLAALGVYLYLLKKKSKQEKKMQSSLRNALKSAESANAAKSQFLSNMSHDIRTPMNAVIGMTAIAGMHLNDPEKIKDCLNKITISSGHLLELINDVLDMSKIESGKIALNDVDFMLPEFLQSFLSIIQPQAKSKQLDLEISVNNLEHEQLTGDTLRINQILLNIVGNAIKFTPEGGKVSFQLHELPQKYKGYATYQFVISDTGVGMPESFLEKIFQPFERAQSSTGSKVEGTGLGMAITKSIVDMMNGQIAVQSEPGKGSTFIVTIHLKIQDSQVEHFDFSALRELKSLIVDDDRDVCINTARMLEDIGMKSEWALNGADAVEKTISTYENNQSYHSVIIDWKMPDMDGLETTRRIRNIVGEETPIIILTAYDWTEIEEQAKAAGVNAFLTKPLFKSRLYHVMRDIISGEQPNSDTVPENELDSTIEGRILLVEDNAMNMEIAGAFIQHCGGTVDKAWDGEEAVRKVQESAVGYYDLIFMDVQMPKMDGYEATRQIRLLEAEQGKVHTPIVAMSANAFAEDIDKAYHAGMDAYITKPVGNQEIRNAMSKYIKEI